MRRLYNWVISWAKSPYGSLALFLLAFAESSVFPIPPDVLLIALALGRPDRAFIFAANCSGGSVLGGAVGYAIGWQFMEQIGLPILRWYNVVDKFEAAKVSFQAYGAWAVAVAGFTPIPYKVFTIASGATLLNFPSFLLASFLSRSARFFLVGGLIYFFGPAIQIFIDRYFNLLTVVFTILLLLGFLLLGWFR